MIRPLVIFRLALLLFSFLFFTSCSVTDPTEPVDNPVRINVGTEVTLATGSIGTGGGQLVVPPGVDTLAGLTIEVTPGAYADARAFKVSYAPVTGIENGGDYRIISPAILVENGGDYAEEMMTMKIPVSVSPGSFAMAFAYDESGSLEALPILDQDATSVTLWTTHFEHSAIHDPAVGKRVVGSAISAGRRRSLILVIEHNIEKLMRGSTESGFAPGVDDWQFRNRGSVIAPGGHCAGQSWAMMYYYMDQKKRKSAPPLNGRFDNDGRGATPKVWHDDVSAYRYCSALQNNYTAFIRISTNFDAALKKLGKPESYRDSLMFMAFKLGLHVTKSPQYVTVWTPDSQSGHAMVIYGATANHLKICDPNYPGNLPNSKDRVITFSGGRLQPYSSAANAEDLEAGKGKLYPVIWYYGTTSSMNWTVAKNEWPAVESRTGGQNYFASYIIKVRDTASATFVPLTSGWKSKTGRVQVVVETESSRYAVKRLFRSEGTYIDPTSDWFTLPDGRTQLGFYVQDTAGPTPTWAGFRWEEVVGKSETPAPRCTRDKSWETTLGTAHIVYTDSTSKGRRFIFEDLGEPEDICSDVHVHPQWEVKGSLVGLTVTASAYWGGLFGDDVPMTVVGSKATATMEIGLKQAYGTKPAWIGLQVEVTFPSRGSLAADMAYIRSRNLVSRISMNYKEHAD